MDRKLVLSNKAEKRLSDIFDYLVLHWSVKVKADFIKKLDESLAAIKKYPEGFPESEKEKGLRQCVVTKHNTLFYRFDADKIYILTVFDTRQHPDKLDKDFK